MQDLWDRALGEVEVEVSKAVFLTLFKQTALVSFENDTATVAAPSIMIVDLLRRRFYEIVKKALDKQTSLDTKIVFVSKSLASGVVLDKGPLFEKPQESKIVVGHLPRVRKEYVFENIAVSGTNQLAFVSAKSVSKNPGVYNPLFIHGPVGVGKTHLLQAIANDLYSKSPDKKIVYITSEEFTNEVVDAIRGNSTSLMKRKFRNLDLLLIDDVQFLTGKERVQEELFHTFNILVDGGSQVVLSSDKKPSELKGIEKRLVSRFSGGLTVDIEPSDMELRSAILLIKAGALGITLPFDSAEEIAKEIKDNRELVGVLLKVITTADSLKEPVSKDLVRKVLGGQKEIAPLGAEEIINKVCLHFKIKPSQIRSEKRDAFLVGPRQIAMYLLKKELGLSFSEIGGLLGGRDHTTIMHGVSKVEFLVLKKKFPEELLGISSHFSTKTLF